MQILTATDAIRAEKGETGVLNLLHCSRAPLPKCVLLTVAELSTFLDAVIGITRRQAMNQPYYQDLVFSLSELLDNGVVQHAELIDELSAAASGEAQLKESLVNISKARTKRNIYMLNKYLYILSEAKLIYWDPELYPTEIPSTVRLIAVFESLTAKFLSFCTGCQSAL